MSHTLPEKVDILGVGVACLDLAGLFDLALNWADQEQARTIVYANAHNLNLAYRQEAFRQSLNLADVVYADGISVVWAARLLYGRRLVKMTGRAWLDAWMTRAAQAGLRIYLLAGYPGVVDKAGELLARKFPGVTVVGRADGYFQGKSETEVIADIHQSRPHLVFVGMGSPRQELWLLEHRKEINAPVCWAVGALLDYPAGVERPTPPWLDQIGLEWLWRLVEDPGGKWRRYLLGNPLFLWRVFRQKITGKRP